MFRSQYDTDVTVWSPQGRLNQVEYAMEAVKQGSACLGLVGKDHVVLAALKRQPNELSAHQRKLLKIDNHMAVAIAGLNADARTLAKYMRTECLNHKYVFGAPLQGARLVLDVADKYQRCTQMYVRRPYGVGLLVGTIDATGPHLFETDPSGNYNESVAVAIGARAQSAKTYLEKHHESFPAASLDELIKHALKALAGCVAGDSELTAAAASLCIISRGANGKASTQIFEDAEVQPYLDAVEVEKAPADADGAATPTPAADAMEV
ncbi:20S proteasome subunit alpha type 1 [Pelagophyceae sp. CCMP2097]|nr:20S proteasome subunit alpha type 1 [Pelagophyceae sp. CCMP2097]